MLPLYALSFITPPRYDAADATPMLIHATLMMMRH